MSRETECTGKKFYLSYSSAKSACKRKNVQERYTKYLRCYQCSYCACWHLTTKPKIAPNTSIKEK